jgi:hypothetical protein
VKLLPLMSLLALSAVIASSCRTALRAGTDSDVVTVEIRVIGLQDSDRLRTDLIYTLSQCGLGSTRGSKNEDQIVTFLAKGVRKDDRCDVRVTTSKVDQPAQDWFDEPGLMYEARKALIVSSEGKLKSLAVLQQLYNTPPPSPTPTNPSAWRLYTMVNAPKPLLDLCTCSIGCSPSLANTVAKLDTAPDKKSGTCMFANVIDPNLNRTECTAMIVQCGTDLYKGRWPAGSVVDGTGAKDARLPDLQLETAAPEDISDASIDIYVPQ